MAKRYSPPNSPSFWSSEHSATARNSLSGLLPERGISGRLNQYVATSTPSNGVRRRSRVPAHQTGAATMKRDDVIQLAREACDKTKVDAFYNGYWTITQDELERVIHLATQKAVAEEREACALVCDERADASMNVDLQCALDLAADAIRARKDNT